MLYVADVVFLSWGAGSGMCSFYNGQFAVANNENRVSAMRMAPRGRWRANGLGFVRHTNMPSGQHVPISFKAQYPQPELLTALQAVNRAGTF